MSRKLVIIDGSSLLSTNFYGTLDSRYHMAKLPEQKQEYLDKLLRTSDGQVINGVFGMVKAIEGMIEKVNPSHIVIAWDISRNTFRRDIYPDYKANRSETLPELKSQFKLAQDLFKELGIVQFSHENYEADDIIGTLSNMFEDDISISIWTKDQDAIQLISERTSLWLITSKAKDMYLEEGVHPKNLSIPTGVYEHNPYTIEENYGFMPIQIIDVKAIEGDASDNIPGIAGVGSKTVLPLIKEFGSLEAIYDYFESETVAEMKLFFKELGISSPLNKMMEEIKPHEVFEDILKILQDEKFESFCEEQLAEFQLEFMPGNTDANVMALINKLQTLEEKDLKKKFKEFSKNDELAKIISRVGEYRSGIQKEIAFMCKKLATIRRDIEDYKDLTLNSLILNVSQTTKNKVFEKYEFKSLIK